MVELIQLGGDMGWQPLVRSPLRYESVAYRN